MSHWSVFYAPHTDDEVLGMAGHIIEAKRLKRQVLVVLVTDNLPSPRGRAIFPDKDVPEERRKEWRAACHALGVDATQEWDLKEEEMARNPWRMTGVIMEHMRATAQQFAPLDHHTTMGIEDAPLNFNGSASILAHSLCAKALERIGFTRSFLHGVYIYGKPQPERIAPQTFTMKNYHMIRKREALACYGPGPESIGYGHRSVPELFAGADEDPVEYFQEI